MSVEINYWAVLLAGVSSMVVGSIWYLPAVFGKPWMKMTKVKMANQDVKGAKAAWMYGSVFVASLLTAWVIAYFTYMANQFFANSYLQDAVATAFWLWVGLTGARLYVHDTFEGRRKKLTLLNAMHELVTVLVMALLIGWLHP